MSMMVRVVSIVVLLLLGAVLLAASLHLASPLQIVAEIETDTPQALQDTVVVEAAHTVRITPTEKEKIALPTTPTLNHHANGMLNFIFPFPI
jgi:hypothetical protein